MDKVRNFLFDHISDRDDLNDSLIASYLKLSTKQVGNLRAGKRKLTLRSLLVLSQDVRYSSIIQSVGNRLKRTLYERIPPRPSTIISIKTEANVL